MESRRETHSRGITHDTRKRMRQIHPRTDQDAARWSGEAIVPDDSQQGEGEVSSRRVA